MAVVGIVAAAGSGERLGTTTPKAFVVCGGRPLLAWSVDVLESVCDRVVCAVPRGYEGGADRVLGGASRSESVRLALDTAPEAEICVVHDAARPLVSADLVRRCIDRLSQGLDAAVAAASMTDTVKEADGSGHVLRTLDRANLWLCQTPQVFRAKALRQALDVSRDALAQATDDASLVESVGGSVAVVEAPAENIKVTRPQDLALVEVLMRRRNE